MRLAIIGSRNFTDFKQHKLQSLLPLFERSSDYSKLNDGQKDLCKLVFEGNNVALLSEAGVGKSFCVKILCDFLEQNGIFVAKTASTGVAAFGIQGNTLHSFVGCGLASEDVEYLIKKVRGNKKARRRIQFVKLLIIDEISMLGSIFLDKIDGIFQAIRGNSQPWGGCQVIVCGDCFQLLRIQESADDKLFFESKPWINGNFKVVELKEVVRQTDKEFLELLRKIRIGAECDYGPILDRVGIPIPEGIHPIRLFCKNVDVRAHNDAELAKIKSPERVFACKDYGDIKFKDFLDRNCQAPAILKLKIGARVSLVRNISVEEGLCNGALGTVVGFSTTEPIIQFDCGPRSCVSIQSWEIKEQQIDALGQFKYKTLASRDQVPLKLAWASSIHRSQGATFDHAEIEVGDAFSCGQVYVALSRLKTLNGLYLKSFNPAKITVNPECQAFYEKIKNQN